MNPDANSCAVNIDLTSSSCEGSECDIWAGKYNCFGYRCFDMSGRVIIPYMLLN